VKEAGCVVSVNDDAAVVAMPMSPECEKCGSCMIAGEGKEVLLLAKNSAGAGPGDTVEIEISAGRVIAAAFIIYMIPVLMTIVGFLVGNAITGGAEDADLPIVLSVVFLVVSFLCVWLYDLRLRRVERREAVVTRILTGEEAAAHRRQTEPANIGG
jgi:sigma-E factor negative regulatory protein RseC